MNKKTLLNLFLSKILFCLSINGFAANLSLSAVKINFESQQKIASLKVENMGDTETLLQLKVVSWRQIKGKDQYQPTTDILVVPTIFKLEPSQKQIVRLALRTNTQSKDERTYRLWIEEVVSPLPNLSQNNNKLQLALRLGLPIFIAPNADTSPQYRWSIAPVTSRKVRATLTNEGNVHLLATQLKIIDEAQKPLSALQHVFAYVLPGQSHEFYVELLKPMNQEKLGVQASIIT